VHAPTAHLAIRATGSPTKNAQRENRQIKVNNKKLVLFHIFFVLSLFFLFVYFVSMYIEVSSLGQCCQCINFALYVILLQLQIKPVQTVMLASSRLRAHQAALHAPPVPTRPLAALCARPALRARIAPALE
jgi:heme/copper-type cytochrome/quinol oxidase subunit 3